MRNTLISIIVPVYNVAPYLTRCIDSLCKQTYTNMEIILVDDGSTDGSGDICDMYAQNDQRLQVLHKENGGLSSARNMGLEMAKGEYLAFVDSDDYIALCCIESLYQLAVQSAAEVSVCGLKRTDGSHSAEVGECEKNAMVLNWPDALLDLLYQRNMTSSACGKLYKRSLWQTIRFPEGLLHEDVAVMYKIFDLAKVVAFTSQPYYFYYTRQGSIVNRAFHPDRMDCLVHTQSCMDYMKDRPAELYQAAVSRHFSACFDIVRNIQDKKAFQNEYDFIVNEIKRYRRSMLRDRKARAMNRIAAMLATVNVPLAIWLSHFVKQK